MGVSGSAIFVVGKKGVAVVYCPGQGLGMACAGANAATVRHYAEIPHARPDPAQSEWP